MGMRPIDIIAIAGKTQDAAQTQQASVRAHGTHQDQIAFQQTVRAEHEAHQVNAAAPEDRLELTADGESPSGGSGGGGAEEDAPREDARDDASDGRPAAGGHIDFLA